MRQSQILTCGLIVFHVATLPRNGDLPRISAHTLLVSSHTGTTRYAAVRARTDSPAKKRGRGRFRRLLRRRLLVGRG